jgi:O-antigen/teichoic acid export membrane protein
MFKRAGSSVFRRNVSWQVVGSGSQAALSGLVLLVMGRNLGASGFGQFSIILGFITVANLLMEPRMQDIAARQFWNMHSENAPDDDQRRVFVQLLAIEAALKLLPCLALVLFSVMLAGVANLPRDGALLIVIAAVGNYLAKIGYGVSTGLLRVLGRSDQFTYCGSGELVARLLVLGVLAYSGTLTVAEALITLSITLLISNVAQFALTAHHLGGLRKVFAAWNTDGLAERLREHRRLLFANIGLSAADLMNKDLDVTLLSPVMPAATIGVYKMAKNIALLTWRAVDPFYLALMPELSRRVQLGDYQGTRSLIRKCLLGLGALALGLSVCAYVALALFGAQILGPAFEGTASILAWMLIGVVGSAPLVWGHPLAVALNRGEIAFLGSAIGSAIGLTAFFILVSQFGIMGAAMSWSLAFLPGFLFTAIVARWMLRQHAATARRSPGP